MFTYGSIDFQEQIDLNPESGIDTMKHLPPVVAKLQDINLLTHVSLVVPKLIFCQLNRKDENKEREDGKGPFIKEEEASLKAYSDFTAFDLLTASC